ncbi:MAG TPA: hypothetical protein VJ810_28770 [Blastocatellia bacterium]|nr:hypothetical protein [Blastocatellia bacterium]
MVKQTFGNDQTIIRYLLNELSAEDQTRFEEAYLMDGSLFEQVIALEEELIEDYVKGGLSLDERNRFERHYLASAQRRARIQAAKELFQICSPKSSTQTAKQLAEERQQSVALREQSEREQVRSQASKNQIVFLTLTPGVRDIGRTDRAVISALTSFVELRAALESRANLRSCRAVVKTVDGGGEIWTQEGIKPRRRNSAQYVVVRVPADHFKAVGAQDFTLTIDAMTTGGKDYEELDIYYFQVTAKRR